MGGKKMSDKNERLILSGKAYFACVHTENKANGGYSMELTVDKETAKALHVKGVTIKDRKTGRGCQKADPNDTRGLFVTLKSKKFPPEVVDAKLNPIPKNILIGNGSDVKVKASIGHIENKFGKFVVLNLNAVQVLNLIPYESNKLDGLEAEEGFEADSFTSQDSSNNESESAAEVDDTDF